LHLFLPFEIADDTKADLKMIPETLAFLFWLVLYIVYTKKGPTLSNGIWDALKQTKSNLIVCIPFSNLCRRPPYNNVAAAYVHNSQVVLSCTP
jgi:hypothetical protein